MLCVKICLYNILGRKGRGGKQREGEGTGGKIDVFFFQIFFNIRRFYFVKSVNDFFHLLPFPL